MTSALAQAYGRATGQSNGQTVRPCSGLNGWDCRRGRISSRQPESGDYGTNCPKRRPAVTNTAGRLGACHNTDENGHSTTT